MKSYARAARAPHARPANGHHASCCMRYMLVHTLSTAVTTAVARLVHNAASHDGHHERRLTATHSILVGAVAPHQDAQEAF